MITVTHAGGRYAVHTGPLADAPARLREAGLAPGLALVVTDATVAGLHLATLVDAMRADGWQPHAVVVAPGEASKSLAVFGDIVEACLAAGPDRQTPVLALGGGVVGDLAGFAASALLRGLPLVQLPTTVLAQVDSSIGGKTGVNTGRGKNLVGAFWAPRVVLADPAVLATLPPREVRSGLAEAVKHGLLAGGALLATLRAEPAWDGALARIVREAAAVKAAVVSGDEREQGARAFLNFGHTFGHALETAAGYGRLTHGEAVAVGMRAALHLSASLAAGRASARTADARKLMNNSLYDVPSPSGSGEPEPEGQGEGAAYEQPCSTVDALPEPFAAMDALVARLAPPAVPADVTDDALLAAMTLDKKRDASGLRFVVLDAPGAPRLARGVPEALVRAAWAHARRTEGNS